MNITLVTRNSLDFLTITLFQFITLTMMLFNIPVARQVIGFIYFSFVPGFIVIKLLKLNELDGLETVVLSVGFSIAFLMLTGLLINAICPLFGITKPLSFTPLITILNGLLLVGNVLAYLRSKNTKLWQTKTFGLNPMVILLIGLPVLGIVGAVLANAYNNNLILLAMIIVVSLLFATSELRRILPPGFYPLAVIAIALFLLYHSSLISNYLYHFGSDIFGENFAFQLLETNARWSSVNPYPGDFSVGRTYAMLSVTILPLIYSSLLNLDITLVLKLLNPVIFSLVPLTLYILWSKFVGSKFAFTSTFLFMACQTFYTEMLGSNKQMIGEFFLVLLLLVILNKRMKPLNRTWCFMIFSFALVTSHYALAEIFLFFISFILISSILMKRPNRNITTTMVVYFFVVMFFWYLYTSSSSVFDSLLYFGDYVYRQLGEFFNIEARQETVLRGLGLETPPTIWNAISRAFAYLTEFFIFTGFIGLVMKRTKIYGEKDYFLFILVSMTFLAALILIPGLANTMNMTRFYHILLFFIAPLFVIGAELVVKEVFKRKSMFLTSVLLLIVLIPYFVFQTGFVYEVTGIQNFSLPLTKHRLNVIQLYGFFGYVDAYGVFGAKWLSRNVAAGHKQLYSDYWSRINELRGYGGVYVGDVKTLSNITTIAANGMVYLGPLNVIGGKIVGNYYTWNSSEIEFLQDMNKIYSSGGSEIYKNGLQ